MIPAACPHCSQDMGSRHDPAFCPRCGKPVGSAVPMAGLAPPVPPGAVLGGVAEVRADAESLRQYLVAGYGPRNWLGERWPSKLRVWQAAAQTGEPAGLWLAALCQRFGIGMPPNPMTAVGMFHRAADAGFVPAMTSLGSIYARGEGVPVDPKLAKAWYLRAADGGDVLARRTLFTLFTPAPDGNR